MNPTPDNPSDIDPTKTAEDFEKAFKEFRQIRDARFSPAKPTKAYLIYHHDSYDYEAQTIPLMVCESKERAEDVVAEICVFGASLGRRLLDEYRDENGEDVSDEVYWARVESNRMEFETANWPHFYKPECDDFEDDYNNRPHKRFKLENLKIQELPFV